MKKDKLPLHRLTSFLVGMAVAAVFLYFYLGNREKLSTEPNAPKKEAQNMGE